MDLNKDLEKALEIFKFISNGARFSYMVIEGEPYSKARPRFTKSGHVYKDKKQANNERYLKTKLRTHFKTPHTGNLAVGCIFYRSSKQRIDVDNMLKNVMDAANGIVYIDDCQVTAKLGIIELDRDNPRTVLIVGDHETTMIRELKTTNTCKTCGKDYKPRQGFSSKEKYCSRACYDSRKLKSKEKTNCLYCGKEFEKRTKLQKFCGDECRRNDVRKRNKRLKIYETAFCDVCGKKLSKPTYKRCRSCWKQRGSK